MLRLSRSVLGYLIRSPDVDIRFNGRSRRPPLDPVNALLSFLYTLLTHDCRSAAESSASILQWVFCTVTGRVVRALRSI